MRTPGIWIFAAAVGSVVFAVGVEVYGEYPKDILWYGNSFTNATCCGSSRSVPSIVSDIAVAAGHPAPRNRNASADGQSLQ